MDNLTNNGQNFDSKPKYNLQVMAPNPNQPSPKGLHDRMSQKSPVATTGKKGKRIMLVVLVFILVLGGVGSWWYYAYGQALRMLKQAQWTWGVAEGTENFQQTTSLSLEIKNQNQDTDNMYTMLLGGDKFNLEVSGNSKMLGENLESNLAIGLAATDFNIDLGAKIKVINKKAYLFLDTGNLKDLLGGLVSISDLENIWLEIDLESIDDELPQNYNYNGSITEEQQVKIAQLINNTFDELRNRKVFNVKDLKNDDNGFRKIQLIPKEDKIPDIMIVFANFGKDMVELFSPEIKSESVDESKTREEIVSDIKNMKTEKPEEWKKVKAMFASVNLIVLINPDDNLIQGFEVYLDNLVVDSGNYKTIINGNFKQLVKAIDYYEVTVPDNIKTIDTMEDLFMGGQNSDMVIDENLSYTLDTDEDQLYDYLEDFYGTDKNNPDSDGDGYLDGEEINNGYNPMGGGLLDNNVLYEDYNMLVPVDFEELGSQYICEITEGTWQDEVCLCPEGIEFNVDSGCWNF